MVLHHHGPSLPPHLLLSFGGAEGGLLDQSVSMEWAQGPMRPERLNRMNTGGAAGHQGLLDRHPGWRPEHDDPAHVLTGRQLEIKQSYLVDALRRAVAGESLGPVGPEFLEAMKRRREREEAAPKGGMKDAAVVEEEDAEMKPVEECSNTGGGRQQGGAGVGREEEEVKEEGEEEGGGGGGGSGEEQQREAEDSDIGPMARAVLLGEMLQHRLDDNFGPPPGAPAPPLSPAPAALLLPPRPLLSRGFLCLSPPRKPAMAAPRLSGSNAALLALAKASEQIRPRSAPVFLLPCSADADAAPFQAVALPPMFLSRSSFVSGCCPPPATPSFPSLQEQERKPPCSLQVQGRAPATAA